MTKGFGPLPTRFQALLEFGDMDALTAADYDTTAAIMIDRVRQGGILPFPMLISSRCARLCEANGLLLIFGRVQCGVGPDAKMFGHEWQGPHPDIHDGRQRHRRRLPSGRVLATKPAASE